MNDARLPGAPHLVPSSWNDTCPEPCVEPKPLPEMVTRVAWAAEDGEIDTITGVGAGTSKQIWLRRRGRRSGDDSPDPGHRGRPDRGPAPVGILGHPNFTSVRTPCSPSSVLWRPCGRRR